MSTPDQPRFPGSPNGDPDWHDVAPTPRTDAEASDGWGGDAVLTSLTFARTLERELAAARERVRVLREACIHVDYIPRIAAALAATAQEESK